MMTQLHKLSSGITHHPVRRLVAERALAVKIKFRAGIFDIFHKITIALQFTFHFPAFGHIATNPPIADDFTHCVANQRYRCFKITNLAVAAQYFVFQDL